MRPEVRIVQQQSEEITNADISQTEREAILAKYGYLNTTSSSQPPQVNPQNELTFEEMLARDEAKNKKPTQEGPRPITFDGQYNGETKYGTEDGFTFKIDIVSDMNISGKK